MFNLYNRGTQLCDGLTRREWLRVGGLGAFGLSLPALLGARSEAAPAAGSSFGKAKACILLFHLGGPPQHETWDPKDAAPVEIRGDLKSIASNVPGIRVGELMPRTARMLDRICVLRAMSTSDNAHSSSGYWMLTGTPHQPMNSENAKPGAPNDWPSTAAVVNRLRRGKGGLPAAITLPDHIWNTGMISWPGQDGGFLGRTADPWLIHCDPSTPGFQIPGLSLASDVSASRLNGRLSLLEQVNHRLDAAANSDAITRFDHRSQQAFDLLRAGKARRAFDLHREPAALRDRYGRNRWGQSVLLARRLVESGVSLVQVNWTRMPGDTNDSPAWDTHAGNAKRLKNNLMPPMDLAYSALLEDLESRGLLQETLIVWMGEFGRSPKINGGGGRDHWGRVFSVALAGGGVRGGQVLGSSDKTGGLPSEGRVQPQDLTATVFHCLGYPAHTEIHDTLGRPLAISRGEVISQVI
ncbi:MAG TPA: DUF1501 domain-containing protein, partial [Gemmataceae bacterium]|nr:DUF1501 domain-containing protein [Gemmataceae bacterium]